MFVIFGPANHLIWDEFLVMLPDVDVVDHQVRNLSLSLLKIRGPFLPFQFLVGVGICRECVRVGCEGVQLSLQSVQEHRA